jgi:hypothetical protein
VPLLLVLLALPLALVLLTPVALVQRYRAGTARRPARGWLATVNAVGMAVSATGFLLGAAITAAWVPNAFTAAVGGLAVGGLLGGLGLRLTRWDATIRTLHYTPNRWLVLAISLVVAARILSGLWRSWAVVQAGAATASVVAAFGIAGSLGAGATVLGYYLVYWIGVRRRIGQWQRRALRVA